MGGISEQGGALVRYRKPKVVSGPEFMQPLQQTSITNGEPGGGRGPRRKGKFS